MKNVNSLRTEHVRQDAAQHNEIWTDEHIEKLRLSLITSAINDIRDGRKSQKMRHEAREWFLCDDIKHPLSYVNCCK